VPHAPGMAVSRDAGGRQAVHSGRALPSHSTSNDHARRRKGETSEPRRRVRAPRFTSSYATIAFLHVTRSPFAIARCCVPAWAVRRGGAAGAYWDVVCWSGKVALVGRRPVARSQANTAARSRLRKEALDSPPSITNVGLAQLSKSSIGRGRVAASSQILSLCRGRACARTNRPDPRARPRLSWGRSCGGRRFPQRRLSRIATLPSRFAAGTGRRRARRPGSGPLQAATDQ
jgi:hypothetical protein